MLGIQTCHCQNVIVRETMISCRSNSATIYDINYFPDHSDEVQGHVPCKLSKNTTSVLVHHSTGQVWTRRSKIDFFNRFFQALCCESSSKVGFFGREMEVCCSTRLTPLRFNSARVQKVSFYCSWSMKWTQRKEANAFSLAAENPNENLEEKKE